MSRKVVQIIASVALIGGSLTYLLSTSLSDEIEYFHPADVVIKKGPELEGKRFRMGGYVLKDSIFQKKGALEYQFDVRPIYERMTYPEVKDKTVTVRYTGLVPDTFKDDSEVIVTGTLQAGAQFTATDLLAKCPSKYEAEDKNKGEY